MLLAFESLQVQGSQGSVRYWLTNGGKEADDPAPEWTRPELNESYCELQTAASGTYSQPHLTPFWQVQSSAWQSAASLEKQFSFVDYPRVTEGLPATHADAPITSISLFLCNEIARLIKNLRAMLVGFLPPTGVLQIRCTHRESICDELQSFAIVRSKRLALTISLQYYPNAVSLPLVSPRRFGAVTKSPPFHKVRKN